MTKKVSHSQLIKDYVAPLADRIRAVLPPEKAAGVYLAVTEEYLLRHPELMQAERHSLDEAIIDAAMLGLELGGPFDLATIIPYKDREGRIIANMVVEYRGHMVQVYRTGKIKTIEARPVYEADDFAFEFGRRPRLSHVPAIVGHRGPLVYAYAIAQLTDGGSAVEVITQHDADKARADSPTADRPGSLWKKRPAEMWTKTAIKKLVNRLPRALTTPGASAGKDPPPEYVELMKAVCVSPELYKTALIELDIEFPIGPEAIRAVLAYMRRLYRLNKNGSKEGSRKQQQPTQSEGR